MTTESEHHKKRTAMFGHYQIPADNEYEKNISKLKQQLAEEIGAYKNLKKHLDTAS